MDYKNFDDNFDPEMAKMLAMKVDEEKKIDDGNYDILRVPNGWMYTKYSGLGQSSVFVPERLS